MTNIGLYYIITVILLLVVYNFISEDFVYIYLIIGTLLSLLHLYTNNLPLFTKDIPNMINNVFSFTAYAIIYPILLIERLFKNR